MGPHLSRGLRASTAMVRTAPAANPGLTTARMPEPAAWWATVAKGATCWASDPEGGSPAPWGGRELSAEGAARIVDPGFEPELKVADAFVAAWLPGSEGAGVADVLFGNVDFQGRLSFSWPADESGVGHERLVDGERFAIGYGLTYGTNQARQSTATGERQRWRN